MTSGPWTVPGQDTCRRIIFQLRHPDWTITPGPASTDGQWHARNDVVDLVAPNLGQAITEAEDHVLLDEAASGTLWDRHFVPGEPDIAPLLSVLALDKLRGIDSRTKLPRSCWLAAPILFRPGAELDRRG